MKKFNLIQWFIMVVIPVFIFGQNESVYLPLDIRPLYENHTRTMSGNPGPHYWQNHSEYLIKVELIPSERMVKGKEKIKYFNNSPDTLNQIVIRLYL